MIKKYFYTIHLPGIALFISGLWILWFYYSFGNFRWEAIVIHGLVFGAFYSILSLITLFSLNRFRYIKSIRLLTCLLLPCFLLFYVWIHLSTFIGFLFWTEAIRFADLLHYLQISPELAGQVGYSSAIVISTGIIVLALLSGVFILWVYALWRTGNSEFELSRLGNRAAFSTLFIALFGLGTFYYLISSGRMLSLRGEPFSDQFRTTQVLDLRYKPGNPDLLQYALERRIYSNNVEFDLSDKPNLIIIMMDAARADNMSLYGYERQTTPTIDSLYASVNSIKVDFATSQCPNSECGISTMLSSMSFLRVHPANFKLHEVLYDLGYSVNFFLSGDHTRAFRIMKNFYGNDITRFRDGFDSDYLPSDDLMLIDFTRELPNQQEDDPPSFFYYHLMSTHTIGVRHSRYNFFKPEDYQNQIALMGKGRFTPLSPNENELLVNNYDNGMLQADAIIYNIITELKSKGYLENAVIIITSDHGEGLGENNIFGHIHFVHRATLQVPLIIHFTGSSNEHIQTSDTVRIPFATLQDIAPTLLYISDLPVPDSWEGVNLLKSTRFYSHHLSTFKGGSHALIYDSEEGIFLLDRSYIDHQYRLYHLTTDPNQTRDVSDLVQESFLEKLKEKLSAEFPLH